MIGFKVHRVYYGVSGLLGLGFGDGQFRAVWKSAQI